MFPDAPRVARRLARSLGQCSLEITQYAQGDWPIVHPVESLIGHGFVRPDLSDPVSYTHLDVYKRQIWDGVMTNLR